MRGVERNTATYGVGASGWTPPLVCSDALIETKRTIYTHIKHTMTVANKTDSAPRLKRIMKKVCTAIALKKNGH